MPDGFTTRPVYMGTHGVIASGHYLAARAGQRMFDKGGNAIDATVASGFALNLLLVGHYHAVGGVGRGGGTHDVLECGGGN